MKRILLLTTLCMFFALSACTKPESGMSSSVAREKNPAPEFTVTSLENGTPLKLSELKGKVVLLNFWATWCPPCREEMPSMMKLNSAMAGKPFQMVAVSIDEGGKQDVESFFKSNGFNLPTYFDTTGGASKAYGITGVPESFIIDKNGLLVKKIIGGLEWDSAEVQSFLNDLMK